MRANRRERSRGRRGGLALLALVVVADVALVGAALHMVRGVEGESPSSSEVLASPQASANPIPDPSPSASEAVSAVQLAETRTLTMVSDVAGWRVVRGACPTGGATLEYTVDGGTTWLPGVLPRAATEILQIASTEGEPARAAIVTLDSSCALQFDRTFSYGNAWQLDPDTRISGTYIDGDSITVRGGPYTAPCAEPLDVAAIAAVAALQCGDALYVAPSGGAWQTVDVGPILSLSAEADTFLIASASVDCEGVLVQRLAGDGESLGSQCVPGSGEGPVATATFQGTLWVWSGDQIVEVPLTI